MTKESLERGREISHKISQLKNDMVTLKAMNGNFNYIGLGQDKQHHYDFSSNKNETDLIVKSMMTRRKAKVATLQKEFDNL